MCRNDKSGIGVNKFAQKISQLIKARCEHGCGMLINLVEQGNHNKTCMHYITKTKYEKAAGIVIERYTSRKKQIEFQYSSLEQIYMQGSFNLMFSVHSFARVTSNLDEDAQLYALKILYEDCLHEVIAGSADTSSQFEANVRLSVSRICGELESGPKELH